MECTVISEATPIEQPALQLAKLREDVETWSYTGEVERFLAGTIFFLRKGRIGLFESEMRTKLIPLTPERFELLTSISTCA